MKELEDERELLAIYHFSAILEYSKCFTQRTSFTQAIFFYTFVTFNLVSNLVSKYLAQRDIQTGAARDQTINLPVSG